MGTGEGEDLGVAATLGWVYVVVLGMGGKAWGLGTWFD